MGDTARLSFKPSGKQIFFIFIALLNLAAIAGLFFVEFDNNVEVMLPSDPGITRIMGFLKESDLSGKLVISLALTSEEKETGDLIAAVDRLAASLDPVFFTEVNYGMNQLDMTDGLDFFLERIPQLLDAGDLDEINGQLTREGISGNLKKIYLQALKPGGLFINRMMGTDPLRLKLKVMQKLQKLSDRLGYKIKMVDGHFISQDGRHAMLIAKTSIQVTDIFGVKELFESLDERLKQLPGFVSASVICGHSHTLSNEQTIRKDILLCSLITSLAFMVLFVLVLRDSSTLFIFLIPLSSVFLAVNLSYWFLGKLSYSVVGLGSVLAGIAVDHAIHVYVSIRKGESVSESVSRVFAPVMAGTLTTIAAFISFFVSNVSGYHQLAFFSILGISLAVIYSLTFLPVVLSQPPLGLDRREKIRGFGNFVWSNNLTLAVWGVITVLLLISSVNLKFDNDIKKIDGTDRKIIEQENNFFKVWQQKKQAILVTEHSDCETALEVSDRIYREAESIPGLKGLSSLSALWPSEHIRQENAKRWRSFWEAGRYEKLKRLLVQEGEKYQFSEKAFTPFLEEIYRNTFKGTKPDENKFLNSLKERFIYRGKGKYFVLFFFPEDKEAVKAMSLISKRYPETFIVSGITLSGLISKGSSRNILLMAPVSLILVFLITWLSMGNIRETLISLVPVFTSIVWLSGLMPLLGLKLNVANLIACIVLLGICVDYGIFMTYKYRRQVDTGTSTAVALAATTTICGAGSLIFAQHPALFSVGVTMLIGVTAGYLSSVMVVPRLISLFITTNKQPS